MVEQEQDEQGAGQATQTRKVTLKVLGLPEAIAVGALANRLNIEPVLVIKQLMRIGIFANINQIIDFDTASNVIRAFGYSAKQAQEVVVSSNEVVTEDDKDRLEERPPVVTILGHVDHGKTTLLDAIRKSNVVGQEAGGITQHIGAYQVDHNGHLITFLDTPGHQAFTAMRARGAQVTDVAVLVVAADDGVMPQTKEAIDHIKAAGVPIIVVINKVDVPDADTEKVKRQLSEHELVVEDWGGDVIAIPVSAKQGTGIEDLLESLLLVAEMAELKANPDREAIGVVVESRMDKSQGPTATILIQTGTLRVGDNIVVGTTRGRVKALVNEANRRIKSAGPSMPVEVLGISDLPIAGDRLSAVVDERTARDLVHENQRVAQTTKGHAMTLEEFHSRASTGVGKEMNLVLKTDVQGSIDAVRTALDQLSTEETRVRLIHAATGSVTENDVMLAVASDAVITGFNVRVEPGARRLADQDGVDIRLYEIIYRLTEDIEAALTGLLEPVIEEVIEGRLEVRATFALGKSRITAGCYVLDGQISRGSMARVLRNGQRLFDGSVSSLRRFKDDVRQVTTGYECGVSLDGFNDYETGDIIEAHLQRRASRPS